jgi:hypothetical protein
MDMKLLYVMHLDAEERELWERIAGKDHVMNVVESYQWILLAEISQHRAAAQNLHARLVSLTAVNCLAESNLKGGNS